MDPWLEDYLFVKPVKEDIRRGPLVIADFQSRIK